MSNKKQQKMKENYEKEKGNDCQIRFLENVASLMHHITPGFRCVATLLGLRSLPVAPTHFPAGEADALLYSAGKRRKPFHVI
jgi:hypothetical protein